jgi:hypothetical protein
MGTRIGAALRAWWPARRHLLPPAEHERVLAAARIEQHGGLTALYLAGTPYEMGYQHGVLARDLILGFRRTAYAYVTSLVPGPGWLARPLLFYQGAAYWPTIPSEIAEEIQGIADGAGIHPIEVLVSTAIWEMFLVSGCSEFAAVAPVTAAGSLIHGYNYDLMHPDHALIQPYLMALFYRPNQGLPFVTVNTAGSVGTNAGLNEAGISVAWDNTYLKDDELTHDTDVPRDTSVSRSISLPVVPYVITLRRLLQHSQRLEDAVWILVDSLPRPLADIAIVGSAEDGRAVAVETAGRVHAVRGMEGGALWSTNCFRSATLAPYDRRGDGRGLPAEAAWQRFPRYMAYSQLFAACESRLTPATAAAFLRDPYPREAEGFVYPSLASRATICRDITSWSLVMEPEKGRLWISDTEIPGCQGRFYAFDLAGWQRLPDQDLPPTGYQHALRCGEQFLAGDRGGARLSLDEALALDGETAPLLLMQAVLDGLEGEEAAAADHLREVQARWGGLPVGALARVWLEGEDRLGQRPLPNERIPFPSAIRPLLHFRPADTWFERATPGTAQSAPAGTPDGAVTE